MDNPSCRDDSEYAPPLPPLVWPKTNLDDSQHNGDASRRLRPGCYVVDCKLLGIDEPIGTNQYFGTMRLEIGESGVRFSGDLYLQHPESLVVGQLARGAINSIRSLLDRPIAIETVKKNIRTLQLGRTFRPAMGIPVFPIDGYRFYLRGTGVEVAGSFDHLVISFDVYRLVSHRLWIEQRGFTFQTRRTPAPFDFPSAEDFFSGDVVDPRGNPIGQVSFGWVSEYFRQATIEIVAHQENPTPPLEVDLGCLNQKVDIWDIFEEVGWAIQVKEGAPQCLEGDPPLPCPSTAWNSSDVLDALARLRKDASLLDNEWCYRLLCIGSLSNKDWGHMYDLDRSNDQFPREGAVLSARHTFDSDEGWRELAGGTLHELPEVYLRTAIHELGHTMGLIHIDKRFGDNGFMSRLDHIRAQVQSGRITDALVWRFAPQDQVRLKHLPDFTVRPGGQNYNSTPRNAPAADGAEILLADVSFRVEPIDVSSTDSEQLRQLRVFPLGAPVRVDLTLEYRGAVALPGTSLRLSGGMIEVVVKDPAGTRRRVRPLVRRFSEAEIKPGTERHSLTLLHGPAEALFPMPGMHEIAISWSGNGFHTTSVCPVMIVPACSSDSAALALEVLAEPGVTSLFALGGRRLSGAGAERIFLEAARDPSLAPHFLFLALEYLANLESSKTRDHHLTGLVSALDHHVVVSWAETLRSESLSKMLGNGHSLIQLLKTRKKDLKKLYKKRLKVQV